MGQTQGKDNKLNPAASMKTYIIPAISINQVK